MNEAETILGLDMGARRIGVARGNTLTRLAMPLVVVEVDGTELGQLGKLIEQERATRLVIGLPRNLDGDDTDQTRSVRTFAEKLQKSLGLPVEFQDEAGTTKQAETEAGTTTANLDAHAAAIILQDYLEALEKR